MEVNIMYDIEFDKLFDSKRQAVVCFLSLERRYQALYKQFKEKTTKTNKYAFGQKGKIEMPQKN